MSKKINLCNDAMFKSLFTSIEARNVIVDFLNAITGIEKEKLENANFEGGNLPKQNKKEKAKACDILVKIDNNNKIIVEMNQFYDNYIFYKNTDYILNLITRNTKKNNNYPKIILINIDNFNIFNTKKGIKCFKLQDEEGHIENELYNSIHLILENIINKEYNLDIDKRILKFSEFLKNTDLEEMKKIYKKDDDYMKMVNKVEKLMEDPDLCMYYDLEEAHKERIEASKLTGIEQGISQRNIEIAKNLLSLSAPIETISQATGLTIDEIKKLK